MARQYQSTSGFLNETGAIEWQASGEFFNESVSGAISGSTAGTCTVAGTLGGTGALSGSTAGTSTSSGTLTATGALSGTSAGTSTASATLTGTGALAGASAGTCTVTGNLSGGAITGATAGTSTASGTLAGTGALSGTAAGTSHATLGSGAISGSAAGTSTATMTGTASGDSHYVLPRLMLATRDLLRASAPIDDIASASILAGIQADQVTPPKVLCAALSAEVTEGAPFSGVYEATLLVQVQSDSDTSTEDEHHDRAIAVFDLLATAAVFGTHSTVSSLSGYHAGFTAWRVYPTARRFNIDDPHWISELELRVTCCGSDGG